MPVGSSKANVGHSEPAAGIAGLLKVAEVADHAAPNAHLRTVNPHVNAAFVGVVCVLPTQLAVITVDRPAVRLALSEGFGG